MKKLTDFESTDLVFGGVYSLPRMCVHMGV